MCEKVIQTIGCGGNPGGGTDWAAMRAANGHEEPYGVIRFELGNEFSDTGQNYWMSGISEKNKGVVDLYIEGDRMTISGQTSYYQTNNKVAKIRRLSDMRFILQII